MRSNKESLNKEIRETVCDLPDEILREMQHTCNYTPFARRVAAEELARRRQDEAAQRNVSRIPDSQKQAACYVEIWSDKNFEGEYLRIDGPVEFRALHLAGLDWGDSISSLRVGPSAFALVYADEDFKGAMLSFGPGQEVADLDEMEFDNQVDSIRLVNSIKIFDDFRVDDSNKAVSQPLPRKKLSKRRGR